MINSNLAGNALIYCLKLSGAKVVVVDEEEKARTRIEGERQTIEKLGMQVIVLSGELKSSITARNAQRPDDSYREGLEASFPAAVLYTR